MTNDPRRLSPPPNARALQLPMWPDPVRGGPNALLRSALFAGIASKKRKQLGIQTKPELEPEGVTIAAQDGIKIRYAGTQFNQYDADVFFEALHGARRHPLETECMFKGGTFLKAIGRSDSKLNYEDLDNSLRRLQRGTVDIEWEMQGRRLIFTGSLISHYVRDIDTKLYKVTFAKEIRLLFAGASWTQLEWDERRALKGKPLAQWLHSYYSTHAAPYPVSLKFLHEKTGSPTKRLAHFRTEIKQAFSDLQAVLGWEVSWAADLVSVKKPPSGTQGRHLMRKAQRAAIIKKAQEPRRGDGGLMPVSGDLLSGLMKSLRTSSR